MQKPQIIYRKTIGTNKKIRNVVGYKIKKNSVRLSASNEESQNEAKKAISFAIPSKKIPSSKFYINEKASYVHG